MRLVERMLALLEDKGPQTTAQLRAAFPTLGPREISYAVNRLTKTGRATSNWHRGRPPIGGWTVTAVPGRPNRFRTELNEGCAPRLIMEFLDLHNGSVDATTWMIFRRHAISRLNAKNAMKNLVRRDWVRLDGDGCYMTDVGREALEHARSRSDEAKGLEWVMARYDVARGHHDDREARINAKQKARKDRLARAVEAETSVDAEPEVELDRYEKRWVKLMGAARYQDIPAHMIRPLRLLRWTPPLQARSMTGSSGAMLAESRDATGGAP